MRSTLQSLTRRGCGWCACLCLATASAAQPAAAQPPSAQPNGVQPAAAQRPAPGGVQQTSGVAAQPPVTRVAQQPAAAPSTAYLTPDFLVVGTARPKLLFARAELAPLVELALEFEQQSGIDFRQVDEVTAFIGPGLLLTGGTPAAQQPTAAVILRSALGFDQRKVLEKSFPGAKVVPFGALQYHASGDPEDGGIFFPDAKSLVTSAQQSLLPKMLAVASAAGPLAEGWQRLDKNAALNLVVAGAPLRKLIADAAAAGSTLTLPLDSLPDLTQLETAEISLAADLSTQITLRARDKAGADALLRSSLVGLRDGILAVDAQLADLAKQPQDIQAEFGPAINLERSILGMLRPKVEGSSVVIKIDAARSQAVCRALVTIAHNLAVGE